MRRLVYMLVAISLLVAACGGDSTSTSTAPAAGASDTVSDVTPSTEPAPDSTANTTGTATTDTTEEPSAGPITTDFDGPTAADFTIDLNKTGSFTLSEEARPVYLVFWAEW